MNGKGNKFCKSYHRHIEICNTTSRLLGFKANCNHQPWQSVVPHYRWHGLEHNDGSKILIERKRDWKTVCEDAPMWGVSSRPWFILPNLGGCTSQTRQQSSRDIYREGIGWCENSTGHVTTNTPYSSKQLFTRKQKQVHVCVLRLPYGVGAFSRGSVVFFDRGTCHDDIDQRFRVISNILKRQDILSLKQMLAQVETGAQGKDVAFTSMELLENIWN